MRELASGVELRTTAYGLYVARGGIRPKRPHPWYVDRGEGDDDEHRDGHYKRQWIPPCLSPTSDSSIGSG
jgi:hypothetical protein